VNALIVVEGVLIEECLNSTGLRVQGVVLSVPREELALSREELLVAPRATVLATVVVVLPGPVSLVRLLTPTRNQTNTHKTNIISATKLVKKTLYVNNAIHLKLIQIL
jgi:hypothetical protein